MFVGLYINDSRLTLGQEYYRDPLYATPLAFDIIPRRSFDKDFGLAPGGKGGKGSSVKDLDSYEAPYNYGTTQKEEIMLKANEEYYIIPSLYTREQPGDYYISVFAECDFSLQGGTQLTADMQPMVLANPDKKTVDGAGGNAGKEMGKTKQLSMTVAQFYERKEELRSKMVSEMIRLGYSQRSVQSVFESDFPDVGEARASPSTDAKVHKKPLRFDDFKRKLVEKGFSLADFPTDDFIVLDEDNNGEIEYEELMKFLDEGFEFARGTNIAKAPPPPVDDTLYKSVNLEGQLTVAINRARDLRKAKTWFSNIEETTSDRITVDCDLPNAMTDTSSLSSSLPFAPEVSRGSGGAISAAALTNSAHMNRAGGTSVANKTMRSTVSLSPIPEKTVPRDKSTSSLPPPPPNEDANNVAKTRPLIQYDPMEAKKVHAETRKQWETDRKHAFVSRLHKKEKAKQQQQQQMMMMSTTMGSFMPEVSTSPRKKSPTAMDSSFAFPVPDTFRSTFQDDDVPPTGRSGITTTRRDMIAKVANDAATKLHTESSLQAAEKNRTERLLKLKSRREKEAAKTKAEAIQATAMLHQKSSTANKVSSSKFRDIHHKSAQEILKMIGINHDEHRGYIPHSQYKDRRIENLKRAKDSKSKANDEDADTLNPETTAKPATSPRPDLHPENTGNESNKGISTQTIKNGDLELTLTVKEEQEDVQGVDIIESRPNSVHVMKDGVEVIDDSRQHDIFDDIIDVVLTIVDSRSAESKAKKMIEFNKLLSSPSAIPASNFTLFNPEPSPLPSPAGKPQMVSARKGTVDVPVGRKTPGIASVKMGMSPASLTPAQRKMQMKGSLTILRELERQQQQTYQEVYRRLVSVPTTTFGEIEGERRAIMSQSMTGDIMRDCFNRIDIDRNGLLSSTEFLRFLRSRSIAVTEEDALTLFERFETNERDGNIDWTEFSGFFERNISSNRLRRSKPDYRPLEVLLQELRMKARNYSKVSGQAIEASPMRKSLKKGGDGEDNGYVIFNSLKVESVGSNAEILRDLGMKDLTNAEMMRISRVFQYNVQNLMRFLRSGQEQGTVVYEHAETIEQAVGKIREIIVNKCLRERIGCETDDATPFDRAKMKKLWSAISASDEVEWDKVTQFFVDMIKQYTHAMLKNKKMAELALQLKSPTASAILGTPHPNPKEGEETYQFELLVRIVVDGMMHSFWNRNFLRGTRIQAAQLTKYPAVIHMLSFTGFEAYIREDYVDSLERKMRYLVHTEKNLLSGSVNLLVHVYLRSDRKNFIVLAYDPISGEVYSSQVNEDVSALPLSTKTTNEIADVVYEKYRDERLSKVVQQNTQQICSRYAFYDPVQTPYEDAALGGMVRRIRLLRGDNSKAKLVFAEDKRFVDQLRGIIDADVNLPFFSVVNDLSVSFEVDNDAIESEVSIQQHIFGSIRQSRALMSFLTTTLSDMRVILCSYNSGIRSTMPWAEMLAHLNNYRNPFVVVQLLPRFVRPTGYCYRVRDDQSAHDGVSDTDPLAPRRGRVCTDGGSMPAWDANVFKMNFKPPKLNMCNVLSTAVAKLKVEGASKYVVVMVREGKRTKRALDGKDTDNDDDDVDDDESDDESDEDEDGSDGLDAAKREESGKGRETRRETEKFWFLTVYDPRSSTEFQCGAKDQHSKFGKMLYNLEKFWAEYKERPESIKKHSAKLLAQETRDALLGESYVNDVLDIFLEQLEDAADSDQLVLGPAITPRLLISVYNRKGRSEELLGSAEVSVSSVLSSANTSAWKWVTLTHTREMAGKEFVEKAGEILVDLSFINKSEIQAAKQAEKERIKRLDNLQRQRSDEADDLSRVSKPAARSGRAAGRAGDVDGVCMQNLPTQSVPVQAAATNVSTCLRCSDYMMDR
jgi:Ca2+-binding EF-hand superfamily protein